MNITHLKLNERKAAIVLLFIMALCPLQVAHLDEVPNLDEVPVGHHLDPVCQKAIRSVLCPKTHEPLCGLWHLH